MKRVCLARQVLNKPSGTPSSPADSATMYSKASWEKILNQQTQRQQMSTGHPLLSKTITALKNCACIAAHRLLSRRHQQTRLRQLPPKLPQPLPTGPTADVYGVRARPWLRLRGTGRRRRQRQQRRGGAVGVAFARLSVSDGCRRVKASL